jgi:cell division protein FtsW (lipid II flippase)
MWYIYVLLTLICILLGVSMYMMSSTSRSDTADAVKSQIRTMFLANFFLIIILGGMMYYYVNSDPAFFKPYMMFMIHANLILSLTGVSISSIQQLN